MLGRLLHFLHVVALPGCHFGFEHQVAHADDGVHGGADFVAHVGQKIGFHARCRLGLHLGLLQGRLLALERRIGFGEFGGPLLDALFQIGVQGFDLCFLQFALGHIAHDGGEQVLPVHPQVRDR